MHEGDIRWIEEDWGSVEQRKCASLTRVEPMTYSHWGFSLPYTHDILNIWHLSHFISNLVIHHLSPHHSTILRNVCSLNLHFSLVGVVKGVITTVIGFFTFGGVPITFLIVSGIVLNTIGGGIYTFAKYRENITMEINKHFVEHTVDVEKVANVSPRDLEEGRHWLRKNYETCFLVCHWKLLAV